MAAASTDDVYGAMDWLVERQADIEAALARRHLEPGGRVLYDLSSSWVEGRCCPLAARGYSRDGKTGKDQIEYGLTCDPEGRPIAVEVFAGNTADPTAFISAANTIKERFGLSDVVLVGDRGMITTARIEALKEVGGLGWVSSLRAPAIQALAEAGALQLSLFDQHNLAEISHPDYPDERLVACRNPALAAERARKRDELLAATEADLAPIQTAVERDRRALRGQDKIGLRVGKVINRHKMAKHFELTIRDDHFSYQRKADHIAAEAALDGIYVIRASAAHTSGVDAPRLVEAYKDLKFNEAGFRSLKTIDLDLRPIHHWTEPRVRAHVFICMLALHLVWHLRQAWAPICFTDEHPPERSDPVAPAVRSPHAAGQDLTPTPRRRPTHPQPRHPPRRARHPHPQHHRLHRRRPHHQARHPHPPTTARLRAHRRPHPHPPQHQVVRTTSPTTTQPPAQQGVLSSKLAELRPKGCQGVALNTSGRARSTTTHPITNQRYHNPPPQPQLDVPLTRCTHAPPTRRTGRRAPNR